MQRPKVSSILAVVALAAAAVIPVFAAPADAANVCNSGQFPSAYGSQSGLKVVCHTDAGTNSNHVEIHDAENADWHHAAARNATLAPAAPTKATTANNATIRFKAGVIQTRDIRRPINAFNPTTKASVFKGGTFITAVAPVGCTAACTSATISQTASLTMASVVARIEMSTNRTLKDAVCSAGTNTMTSGTAKWVAADIGKSVAGTPFAAGTFITAVSGTTATMNQTHSLGCVAQRLTTIGGSKYVGGNPVLFTGDAMNIQLSNNASGAGFSCAAGSHTLAMTAGGKADTGGFVATQAGISVSIKGTAATPTATTATAVSTAGNTSLTLAGTCPAGVTAAAGLAWVGIPGSSAPPAGSPMMTLAAELNLNPQLVATQDDCSLGTFEGFEVVGGWQPPGTYTASAVTPRATTAQVLFPTSVISFNGFVVPKAGGDPVDASPHYNFSFPILPTSLAVCLAAGSPADPVQLAFGINAAVKSGAPFLATGSGNPGDPPLRSLQPVTGSFSQTMELILNPSTVVATSVGTPCVIGPPTAAPSTSCGDG